MIIRSRTRRSGRKQVWHFEYDSDDRLTVAYTDGQRWVYRYDAFDRRISKTSLDSDGQVVDQTLFSWDGDLLVEQTRLAGKPPASITWEYMPGGHRPVSQISSIGLEEQFYAVVSDLIGTPTELVSADGRRVVWTNADTTLWGAPRGNPEPTDDVVDCPLRFPGQYADAETGLHYNRHRYYDPETARYTTADPLGLAPAPDPYAYVPNPHHWADPLGLAPCDPANLRWHEAHGGHTIEKHVGKSLDYLIARDVRLASTFLDFESASQATEASLSENAREIRRWLNQSHLATKRLEGGLGQIEGLTYVQDLDSVILARKTTTFLRRSDCGPYGFIIRTSYPDY